MHPSYSRQNAEPVWEDDESTALRFYSCVDDLTGCLRVLSV